MLSKKGKLIMFILAFSLLAGSTGFNIETTAASTGTYHVKTIDASGKLTTVGEAYTDFNLAKTAMNKVDGTNVVLTSTGSKSPLQIVAMKSGYAQSYPYRTGNGFGTSAASQTLNIYPRISGGSSKTYIAAHYKMFYHDTFENNGKLIAEITIQGARGFVDITKTDLIPMYFVDNKIPISIGGNENFYNTPELKANVLVQHDYYSVLNNEVTVNYSRTYNRKLDDLTTTTVDEGVNSHPKYATTFGEKPSWLENGKNYYSKDGVIFYYDSNLKEAVMDKRGKVGEYYAYYQWLPVRSMSNITGDNINLLLESKQNSVIYNNEQAFIESGNKYGMNALLLYAQAVHESAYGTSSIATSKYNLFGWNAVDSNPGLATKYDGVFASVERQMSANLSGYFDDGDWRNEGLGFGNKASGISVRYASDPYYGVKVAAIAYQTDKNLGFIDHNMYDLVKLDIDDGIGLSLRKSPTTSSAVWGTTKGSIDTDIRTNLGVTSGFIKTNLPMVVKNGRMTKEVGPVDLTKEFGYLSEAYVEKLEKSSPSKGKIPTNRVVVLDQKEGFQTTNNLNLRSSWTTDSRVFHTIPNKTFLEGFKTNNGWIKVTHKNQVGYVHADYVTVPNSPSSPTYALGDVDGDGEIDGFDMMLIRDHYLGIEKLTPKQMAAADVDGDGEIDGFDMMIVRDHYLEIELIKE